MLRSLTKHVDGGGNVAAAGSSLVSLHDTVREGRALVGRDAQHAGVDGGPHRWVRWILHDGALDSHSQWVDCGGPVVEVLELLGREDTQQVVQLWCGAVTPPIGGRSWCISRCLRPSPPPSFSFKVSLC